MALLDTLRANVQAMVNEGVATRSDLLTVEVKLNQAQVDQTKVDNGLVLSKMALAQLCGLPVDTPLTLADEDADLHHTAESTPMAASTYDMADVYERRADLRALGYGVKMLEQGEKVALSAMLPNLAIVGAYSFSNPNMFDGFKKRFSGAFSVGAMLSVPIWHWGSNYNKLRAARSRTAMARLELADAREMVSLQVSQSAFRAQEAQKTFIGFREGVMTTDNVMEAQTAWLKANSENIDAMIDVRLCDVYLSKVLGTLQH